MAEAIFRGCGAHRNRALDQQISERVSWLRSLVQPQRIAN
jgi:hypothetical protein